VAGVGNTPEPLWEKNTSARERLKGAREGHRAPLEREQWGGDPKPQQRKRLAALEERAGKKRRKLRTQSPVTAKNCGGKSFQEKGGLIFPQRLVGWEPFGEGECKSQEVKKRSSRVAGKTADGDSKKAEKQRPLRA